MAGTLPNQVESRSPGEYAFSNQGCQAESLNLWGIASIVALCAVLGFLFSFSDPVLITFVLAAVGGGLAFVWAYLRYPVLSLALVLMAQILLPVYVRIPIPGLPLPPALLLIAAVIGLSFLTRMLRPVKSRIGSDEKALATAILIYSAVLFFTTVLGGSPPAAMPMWIKTSLIPVCFFFVFLGTVKNSKDVTFVLNTLLIAAVACGIFAVQEYATKSNAIALWLAPEVTREEDFFLWFLLNGRNQSTEEIYRVYSFFTQPLEFSAFMVMSMPYAMLRFLERKKIGEKLLFGGAALAIFMGFAVTFSRGPTLALIVTTIILSVYKKSLRMWLAGGFAFAGICIVLAWPIIGELLTKRIQGTPNVSLRFSLWENGIALFLQNPLTGIGYGAYPSTHAFSIEANQIGPMYEYTWQHIDRIKTLENIFVTLAAETGLIGLASFFFVLGIFFHLFSKVMRTCSSQRERTLALASLGAVLAYLLSGLTVANIILYTISILFFGVYVPIMAVLLRNTDVRSSSVIVSEKHKI